MFLHSGLAIKSPTDSVQTQIFQQNRLSGMSVPMGGRRKTPFSCRTAGTGDAQMLRRNARKRRNDAKLRIKNTHTSSIDEGNALAPVMTLLLWLCEQNPCVCSAKQPRVLPPPSTRLAISHPGAAGLPVQLPPVRARLRISSNPG